MRAETCTRCGGEVPDETPSQGTTYRVRLRRETTTIRYRMVFERFRWAWMPENPADQVRGTWTDLELCERCSLAAFDFAVGRDLRPERAE